MPYDKFDDWEWEDEDDSGSVPPSVAAAARSFGLTAEQIGPEAWGVLFLGNLNDGKPVVLDAQMIRAILAKLMARRQTRRASNRRSR